MEHKKLYITENEGNDIEVAAVNFSPDRLIFHPKKENWLLAYDYMQRTVSYINHANTGILSVQQFYVHVIVYTTCYIHEKKEQKMGPILFCVHINSIYIYVSL